MTGCTSVNINTTWTGPDEFTFNSNEPVDTSTMDITHRSIATVSQFGRAKLGNYTCTVSLNSTNPFIQTSNISADTVQITYGNTLA